MSPLPRKLAPPSSFGKWTSGTLSSPGSPGVGARPDLGRDLTRQSAEDPVHPQDERLIAVPGDRLIDRGALERELLAVWPTRRQRASSVTRWPGAPSNRSTTTTTW